MTNFSTLKKPIAVFDSGVGSYAAVAALQRALPKQDILYFADRASFPYGSKGRAELLNILNKTLRFLHGFDPSAILVASNAPSITVLDDLQSVVPVFGVRPPIKNALKVANAGNVAILGVRSLVESPEMRAFVAREAGELTARVHLVNASPLVELVESGEFLSDSGNVQKKVEAFVSGMDASHAGITAMTLSSTHLPWLRFHLEKAAPGRPLLDPLESVVAEILPLAVEGSGRVIALATESERYPAEGFQRMLDRLGADISVNRQPILA